MISITVDDLEAHARTLSTMASAVLLGLAHGKYDGQSEVTAALLSELKIVLPPSAEAAQTIEVFSSLAKLMDAVTARVSPVPASTPLSGSKSEEFAHAG